MKNTLKSTMLTASSLLLSLIFLTGCSKDDGPSKTIIEEEAKPLVLTISNTSVSEGDVVQFAVTAMGEAITNATIYINDVAIASYEHIFIEPGDYKVMVKKEGYSSSEIILIQVQEELVDIYVAGYEIINKVKIATYWKNGEPHYLTDGETHAETHAIVVHGSDVYVLVSDGYAMKYWKNQEEHTIHNQPGWYATPGDMIMSENGDLYITGAITEIGGKVVAKYWKNGVSIDLNTDYEPVYPSGIAISGDNVYIAGSGTKKVASPYVYNALYWGNDVVNVLSDSGNSTAHSIAVSGSDVHVVGHEDDGVGNWSAKYWKNGEDISLPEEGREANDIVVLGDDVHIVGRGSSDSILYWKNNTLVETLSGSAVNQITLRNDDVYIVGANYNRETGNWTAVYWKNNVMVPLTDHTQDATAKSIAVAKR